MYKFETSKYIGHWIPDNRPTKTLKTYKKKITKSKQKQLLHKDIFIFYLLLISRISFLKTSTTSDSNEIQTLISTYKDTPVEFSQTHWDICLILQKWFLQSCLRDIGDIKSSVLQHCSYLWWMVKTYIRFPVSDNKWTINKECVGTQNKSSYLFHCLCRIMKQI